MRASRKASEADRLHKLKGMWAVPLVIGLILIIPLLFVVPMLAGATATPPLATPLPATPYTLVAPSATVPPWPTSIPFTPPKNKPPACEFPLAQTTTSESVPENYTFSEPRQLPLSNSDDNDLFTEIVEWLPDNRHALLLHSLRDAADQTIELFDAQTGEIQVYATREEMASQYDGPVWVSGLNGIVYPETRMLSWSYDAGGLLIESSVVLRRLLWLVQDDPAVARPLEDAELRAVGTRSEGASFSLAVKPDGSQFIYLGGDRREQLHRYKVSEGSLETVQSPRFDITQLAYRNPNIVAPESFRMAWRPGTSQVYLYSRFDSLGNYSFLLDADTGEVCEVDLFGKQGGWPMFARWSPNGRYLAVVRANRAMPVDFSELIVLDAATGQIYTMGVTPQDKIGNHYVKDISWAPDNHHLLVVGSVSPYPPCVQDCLEDSRLYLVEFLVGDTTPVLPSYRFFGYYPGLNLAWSSDGSKVLVLCSDLCLISVQTTTH